MERHSIELVEGARVLKDRPYPISPAKQKLVEDKIDKMLEPLYLFRMMPFRLCNVAQRLVWLMDRVIPVKLRANAFVYPDDLLNLTPAF